MVPSKLPPEYKEKTFESLIFIKDKKGGNNQGEILCQWRESLKVLRKGNLNIPVVSTEAVMITSAIEAKEKRDMAVIETPNYHSYQTTRQQKSDHVF